MIRVSDECYRALRSDPIFMRPKCYWHLSRGAAAIDVSEYVEDWGVTSQHLRPFLDDPSFSDHSMSLSNTDGRFTTRAKSGLIPDGPESYYGTKVRVAQEVILPDGRSEEIPVYSGRVQYALPRPGRVEIKSAGILAQLRQYLVPEDVPIGFVNSTGIPAGFSDGMTDLLATTPYSYASDFDTSDARLNQIILGLPACGWTLGGGVTSGGIVGSAVQELARSCLSNVVDTEDGKLRIVPLALPRTLSGYYGTDVDFPDTMEDPRAMEFELYEGVDGAVSEMSVRYGGGLAASYRDTAAETRIGRRTVPPVSMEFVRLGSQAAYAARLVYEFNKSFPLTVAFLAPGLGMLVQLGDLVYLRDTITGERRRGFCFGKAWKNPGMVTLVVRTSPALGSGGVFDTDWPAYGSGTWGDTVL